MSFPRAIYHKEFDAHKADEASLKKHCKIVHSDEEVKELGSDWGPHPFLKSEVKKEQKKEEPSIKEEEYIPAPKKSGRK